MQGPVAILFDIDSTLISTGGAAREAGALHSRRAPNNSVEQLHEAPADFVIKSFTEPLPGTR